MIFTFSRSNCAEPPSDNTQIIELARFLLTLGYPQSPKQLQESTKADQRKETYTKINPNIIQKCFRRPPERGSVPTYNPINNEHLLYNIEVVHRRSTAVRGASFPLLGLLPLFTPAGGFFQYTSSFLDELGLSGICMLFSKAHLQILEHRKQKAKNN